MTFLIKIQLLNWQQNVYQSKVVRKIEPQSSPYSTKVLQIEHINYRPVTGGRGQCQITYQTYARFYELGLTRELTNPRVGVIPSLFLD